MKTFGHSIILIVLIAFSCRENHKSEPELTFLEAIDFFQEIRLTQQGDEYGEWGGNISILRIYRDSITRKILGDFRKLQGSEKPPSPPEPGTSYQWENNYPILIEKSRIELSNYEKSLVEKSVVELVENKIKNNHFIAHSGISNSIELADSSMILRDYPSIEWRSFQKLVKSILEK